MGIRIVRVGDQRLVEAARDLLYLLNRGYSRRFALNVVSNRYGLDRREQMVLYRSIHPDETVSEISSKEVGPEEVRGSTLSVDWYNILVTVNSCMVGEPVYIGNDGYIRDVRGLYGRVEALRNVYETMSRIVEAILNLSPSHVSFYLEKNISYSRQMMRELEAVAAELGLASYSITLTATVDTDIVSGGIVATNDFVVLLSAGKVFNLTRYIAERLDREVVVYRLI